MAFDAPPEVTPLRTRDPASVNACFNHPEVRPHVGLPDAGPLDMSAVLADENNYALAVPHGVFLFARDDQDRWEMHTCILPEGRGAAVLPAVHAAFRWMFVHTPCVELITRVPHTNKPAALVARRAGFAHLFTRPAGWHDGADVDYFTLTLDRWRGLDATLAAEGHAFHETLSAAKVAAGISDPPHPDDEAHDRAVGLACLMAKAGNHFKAAWAYNRWARLAGYHPVSIEPPTAPVFNTGDALITFAPELEIVQCLGH